MTELAPEPSIYDQMDLQQIQPILDAAQQKYNQHKKELSEKGETRLEAVKPAQSIDTLAHIEMNENQIFIGSAHLIQLAGIEAVYNLPGLIQTEHVIEVQDANPSQNKVYTLDVGHLLSYLRAIQSAEVRSTVLGEILNVLSQEFNNFRIPDAMRDISNSQEKITELAATGKFNLVAMYESIVQDHKAKVKTAYYSAQAFIRFLEEAKQGDSPLPVDSAQAPFMIDNALVRRAARLYAANTIGAQIGKENDFFHEPFHHSDYMVVFNTTNEILAPEKVGTIKAVVDSLTQP